MKMSELLPLMKAQLRESKYDFEKIAVFMITAGDQILGQVEGDDPSLVGRSVTISSPKRFIRLQKATQTGLEMNFLVTDLDMIDDGTVQVHALVAYRLKDLNEESQGRYLGFLLDHLSQREQERRARSGIILPGQSEPRAFVMPNLRGGQQ